MTMNQFMVATSVKSHVHERARYGTGFCDDAGNNYVSLNYHANFTAENYGQDPKLRSLNGHVQGEVFFSNAYHFMDIDENMFYLDHENERVVSGDDVAADHDLGKREHTWQGPKGANQPDAKQVREGLLDVRCSVCWSSGSKPEVCALFAAVLWRRAGGRAVWARRHRRQPTRQWPLDGFCAQTR